MGEEEAPELALEIDASPEIEVEVAEDVEVEVEVDANADLALNGNVNAPIVAVETGGAEMRQKGQENCGGGCCCIILSILFWILAVGAAVTFAYLSNQNPNVEVYPILTAVVSGILAVLATIFLICGICKCCCGIVQTIDGANRDDVVVNVEVGGN